jgi:dihydrofolate reductase
MAVHEFISLDGVFEDPRWTVDFGFDPRMGDALAAITGAATAILLGRTTYEMFAPVWSTRTVEDDPGAPFFNDTHKYVVGGRQPNVDWGPSTRLGAFDAAVIRKVKDEADGLIYVSGSGTLVRSRRVWWTSSTCSSIRSSSDRASGSCRARPRRRALRG